MAPSAPTKIEDRQFDSGKEFAALRSEILAQLKDVRSLERYALVTTGAIWTWLITHRITAWQPWAIPVALVLIAAVQAWNITEHLGRIGEYIREDLEPKGKGAYESFLIRKRAEAPLWRRVIRFASDYGSWILLFLCSVAGVKWGPQFACLAATKLESIKLPF